MMDASVCRERQRFSMLLRLGLVLVLISEFVSADPVAAAEFLR